MDTVKIVKPTENTPLLLVPPLNIPSGCTQKIHDAPSKLADPQHMAVEHKVLKSTTSATSKRSETRKNLLGMLLVALGCFFLSTGDAMLKYVMNVLDVSLFEVIIVTNFIQHLNAWILWLSPNWIIQKPEHASTWYGEKEDRVSIWLRGLFYYGDMYLFWYGITIVPLGDAETIYLLIPLCVAIGGRIFLKDPLSKTFPLSSCLSIIGVIILCQPPFLTRFIHEHILHKNGENENEAYSDSQPISPKGIIFLLCGCVSWSAMNLMVRRAKKAHWIQFELTTTLQAWLLWTPILIFLDYLSNGSLDTHGTWKISWEIIGVIIVCALLFCAGLLCYVLGYQFGSSTKVCWFEYTALWMGYLYQITWFKHIPTAYDLIGSCVVFSTCFVGMAEEYYQWNEEPDKQDDPKS